MKGILWVLAAALFLAAAVAPIACGSDDDESGIGIAAVDAAIEAINAADAQAMTEQAVVTSIACTTADGLGGPPQCLPGEAEGTEVRAMPAAACEGYYLREADIGDSMQAFVSVENTVVAVYQSGGIRDFFLADYVILISAKDPNFGDVGREVFVNDNGITGLFYGCGQTAEQLIEAHDLEGKLSVAQPR